MRPWRPYVWKELRENLWLALAVLGVFLGISFIPSAIECSVHSQGRWYNGNALGVFFLGGPLLAVIAGVYAMGREQGAIEQFWRSRPVGLNRWLLIKYVTGLALVWLICWLPLGIQILGRAFAKPDRSMPDNIGMALVYSFILLLIYSVSFVLGQCVRGMLHAAILAVGAMALIFVVPLVVAPLNWLSVETVQRADLGALNARAHIAFAAPMIVLSAALLGLAGILVKRDAQVEVGGRTLGWSMAVIMLVLTAGMAFPMGTNLSVQQRISLPMAKDGTIHDMVTDGNDVLVLFSNGPAWNGSKLGLVRVHVGEQTAVVDEPVWFFEPPQGKRLYYEAVDLMWSAGDPDHAYVVVRQSVWGDRALVDPNCFLYTVALEAKQADPVIHRVELSPLLGPQRRLRGAGLQQQHLYVYSDEPLRPRLLTFSLAGPTAPSLVRNEVLLHQIGWLFQGPSQEYHLRLAPILNLDDSTRLQLTHELAASFWTHVGDGRVLASDLHSGGFTPQLVLYEADAAQDGVVPLRPIAHRRSPAFEGLLGSSPGTLFSSDHVACRLEGGGVTVYQIDDSNRIDRIGHYAAEGGFSSGVPLPGHRVVLAGQRLHVLNLSEKLPSAVPRHSGDIH